MFYELIYYGGVKMKIGYARVSTLEQNLDLQLDALKLAGCEKFFQEKISGVKAERKALQEAFADLRAGDTLVVWKLDRLGRSLKHLIELTNKLQELGVNFISLQEGFNTSTTGGKLIFHVFGALAEFEKNIIGDRTRAGLAAARARGRVGGRPSILNDEKLRKIEMFSKNFELSIDEICKMLHVSRATYYKGLKSIKNSNCRPSTRHDRKQMVKKSNDINAIDRVICLGMQSHRHPL